MTGKSDLFESASIEHNSGGVSRSTALDGLQAKKEWLLGKQIFLINENLNDLLNWR